MKRLLASKARDKAAKSTQDVIEDAIEDAASSDAVSVSVSMTALPPTPPPSIADPPKASAASLGTRLAAFAKEKSRRLRASAVNMHILKDKTSNTEADLPSLTHKLPPELRVMIWSFVLSPESLPYKAKPAHFHVYQWSIFDACTYDHRRKRDDAPHLMQISLLLTCRGIYNEALRFLYDKQHFTIVLCAGFARPAACLRNRRDLGRAKHCKKLFAKMRFMELVIQPGDAPELSNYAAHVCSFLKAIDYGQHTKALTLHFNFGMRANNYTKQHITGLFHRIGVHHRALELPLPAVTLMTPMRWRDVRLIESSALYNFISQLAVALGPPCRIASWTLERPTGVVSIDLESWHPSYDIHDFGPYCLRRGAWGEYRRYCREHGLGRIRPPANSREALRVDTMQFVGFMVAPFVEMFQRVVKGEV